MKNIGLTYTGSAEKHQNYVRWLQQNDADVNVITLSAEETENKGDVNDCDALVLSGGIDITPGYYNSNNVSYPNMPAQFYEKRDAFEKNMFNKAIERNIPILGICRGLQLINSILGGTLIQDLGAGNTIHKAVVDENKKQFDKAHGLHIRPDSLLAGITGSERSIVNSAHHQSIDALAPGLISNCVSDDDVIEGFEWQDKNNKPFMLSIQWHPERMYEFQLENTALSAGIRNLFLAAIKK
ncbi:MAG: gamma-glutamyl-gamma-aminobutyrate hydrolase family protein [Chitinophagaceae bacterium]